MSDLTVFVGTFNRLDTLERCIENLERQDYPLRIVVVDNGSTWDRAIWYLEELQVDAGHLVYHMPGAQDVPERSEDAGKHGGHGMMTVQRNYSEAFSLECEAGRQTKWFAVCDCDTAPDGDPDSIARYVQLAEVLDCAVGPHLSLNVHPNYPLRSAALILNARVLFRERFEGRTIPRTFDDIDSSFHLFPSSSTFDRLGMRTIRVGPPYWATHTDWLIDVLNPTEENHAYIFGSNDAASWGGSWIKGFFRAWLQSPEDAFALMEKSVKQHNDYFYDGFILSWMLQYGHGCEVDPERSKAVLRDSFPDWSPCWEYEEHWDALLREDETCLGWT